MSKDRNDVVTVDLVAPQHPAAVKNISWSVLTEKARQDAVTQRVQGCETTKYNAMLDLLEIEAAGEPDEQMKKQINELNSVIDQMDKRISALRTLTETFSL